MLFYTNTWGKFQASTSKCFLVCESIEPKWGIKWLRKIVLQMLELIMLVWGWPALFTLIRKRCHLSTRIANGHVHISNWNNGQQTGTQPHLTSVWCNLILREETKITGEKQINNETFNLPYIYIWRAGFVHARACVFSLHDRCSASCVGFLINVNVWVCFFVCQGPLENAVFLICGDK